MAELAWEAEFCCEGVRWGKQCLLGFGSRNATSSSYRGTAQTRGLAPERSLARAAAFHAFIAFEARGAR